MKKIITYFLFSLLILFNNSANAEILDINDDIIDKTIWSEIINTENNMSIDLEIKKFQSCEDMNSKIKELLNKNNYRGYPIMYDDLTTVDMVEAEFSEGISKSEVLSDNGINSSITQDLDTNDYVWTNIQVKWVDESEIIKTNWNYIYFYRQNTNSISIYDSVTLKSIDEIILPKELYNVELFLDNNNFTIIGNMYSDNKYYNVNTFIIVYNIDENWLKQWAKKISKINGYIHDMRKIDNNLFIISNVSLYNFIRYENDVINVDISENMPKALLVEKNDNWNVSFSKTTKKCNDIEYVIPKSDNINVNNMYIITTIDLNDLNKEIPQKIIFWDINTLYMSKNSLFLTSNVYFEQPYRCRMDFCIMPQFNYNSTTLIHKYNINDNQLEYDNYQLVEWYPLTQYSMNEDNDGNFNIITQNNDNKQWVNIYSFNDELKLIDQLNNVWEWERFQSSRYMWDKLYLVTFKQIDPFFVIDLKDKSNLEILWELKIPWYSTYLHPINDTTLLWLWYDTKENEWGWITNGWLKIDIYDVSDLNNPKQKHTLTIWESWTYSEVLNNPKMLSYNTDKWILALSIQKQTNSNKDDYYNRKLFQGSIVFNIDIEKWISEIKEISHFNKDSIENDRKKQCQEVEEKIKKENITCTTLISWNEVCVPKAYIRIPNYCEYWSDISLYINQNYYNYNNDKIIRNLIIDDNVFSLSNNWISRYDISENKEIFNFQNK